MKPSTILIANKTPKIEYTIKATFVRLQSQIFSMFTKIDVIVVTVC